MQSKYKWLLLPPAIALVLFLGPLRMGGSISETARAATSADTNVTSTADPSGKAVRGDPQTPRRAAPRLSATTPDVWQVLATLVGVLLLGGVGLAVFKRIRFQRPQAEGEFCMLRQSLKLSQRQVVHALEFDGQILLVGETDGSLAVLGTTAAPSERLDREQIRCRTIGADYAADDDLDDGGAVPRDMVIPRPDPRPLDAAATLPTRPSIDPESTLSPAAKKLVNFRQLLTRAGKTTGASAR